MPFINGIGPLELIIILVIALIVVGPGRLPDVGAAVGKSIKEFRNAATDMTDSATIGAELNLAPAPATPAPAAAATDATSVVELAAEAPVAPPPPPAMQLATTNPETSASDSSVDASPADTATPDISEMPDPVTVADEQPTPSA